MNTLRYYLLVLRRFVFDHSLTWCAQCGYVGFAKHMRTTTFTPGWRTVYLCQKCYKELYHPWRKK